MSAMGFETRDICPASVFFFRKRSHFHIKKNVSLLDLTGRSIPVQMLRLLQDANVGGFVGDHIAYVHEGEDRIVYPVIFRRIESIYFGMCEGIIPRGVFAIYETCAGETILKHETKYSVDVNTHRMFSSRASSGMPASFASHDRRTPPAPPRPRRPSSSSKPVLILLPPQH